MSPRSALGEALRAHRVSRNLSLKDVATATGISASFLSLVENGRSDITIGRLTRLVEFFGISITDLVPDGNRRNAHVLRRGEGRRVHSPAEGIEVQLLVPDTNRTMMPMALLFEPSARLAEPGQHAGEEFVYVVEGSLLLEVESAGAQVLNAGDSAYYDGQLPHLFANNDDRRPLTLVCVDSPPVL